MSNGDDFRKAADAAAVAATDRARNYREASLGDVEATPWNRTTQLQGAHAHLQGQALAARQERLTHLAAEAPHAVRPQQRQDVHAALVADDIDSARAAALRDIVDHVGPAKSSQATAHQAVLITAHAGTLEEALDMAAKIEASGEEPYLNGRLLRDHLRKVYGSSEQWANVVARGR